DAALADLAERQLMVRIPAHQRWQVERHAQSGAASGEERLVPVVGLFRRADPGKLTHGPQLAAVPGLVNTAGVGKRPRFADISRRVDRTEILGCVQPVDRTARNGREAGWPLAALRQRRFERFALPPLLVRLCSRSHNDHYI